MVRTSRFATDGAEMLALGPDALYAATLGWRLGRLDAEEIAKERIAAAGGTLFRALRGRRYVDVHDGPNCSSAGVSVSAGTGSSRAPARVVGHERPGDHDDPVERGRRA